MQMISADNIELLEKQNTDWCFIKFLPSKTVEWFAQLNSSQRTMFTVTEFSETAGFMRLIPVSRKSMDVTLK